MSKNLEIKKEVVAEISNKLQNAQSLTIVAYNGLTVDQATRLRAQCRAANVEYVVLKNRLVARAMQELNITGVEESLNGPSAFVFSNADPVSGPKIVKDFIAKEKTQALEIKAGLLGKDAMTTAQMEALAEVPSREILLSRLVGSLQSSIASFVRVIDAIAKKNGEPAAEAAPEA